MGLVAAASATKSPIGMSVLPVRNHTARAPGDWDMTWLDKLAKTKYKAVFDSTSLADGAAPDLAAGIWSDFGEVYGADDGACMVIIMRQSGQVMAYNDIMWEKYAIGQERKVNDPVTRNPATRNPFLKSNPGDPAYAVASKLDALYKRGAIFLVCNRASMNWASNAAERLQRPVDEVRADVRKNLVPGAYLMPTGVFALVRAQNAGCAFMRGS